MNDLQKAISDAGTDATMLEGLCQGSIEIFDVVRCETTPASNALYALLTVMAEKADALASQIGKIEGLARNSTQINITRTIVDPSA